MGELVNLHKARKRAVKERDAERAAANRIQHGRTKAERLLDAARSQKECGVLDAHKIDPGEAP
ncbi:MAG: DUF4169 family protein [Alphaproteobacteria bacterium]|nr:MAG: DUF4169 family protein [Alphaproteobacteria bacterium]